MDDYIKREKNTKKVTIIGANSYLARNLIQYVKNEVNLLYLYDIKETHMDHCANYYQIDFNDILTIEKIMFSCDVIYIFTGLTGAKASFHQFSDFVDVNIKYLLILLNEYVRQESKAKIIYPSTRLIYKSSNNAVNEKCPIELKSVYAVNKYTSECYLKMYHDLFGLQYCIARIGVPIGSLIQGCTSYGTFEFMSKQAKNEGIIILYGDGKGKRTFTNIEDVIHILYEIGLCDKCKNDIYNIGGVVLSMEDIAKIISRKYNSEIKYVPWPEFDAKIECESVFFNSNKLDNILGCEYKNIDILQG